MKDYFWPDIWIDFTSASAVPPSTPSPTTVNIVPTTTTTTTQTGCVSGWSAWINKDTPDTGDGDMEKMTSSELTSFCPGGTITQVDCQTVDGIEHFSSGEILTCTTDGGLQCNNADNFPIPCSNYRIKYECTCPGESLCERINEEIRMNKQISCTYFNISHNKTILQSSMWGIKVIVQFHIFNHNQKLNCA